MTSKMAHFRVLPKRGPKSGSWLRTKKTPLFGSFLDPKMAISTSQIGCFWGPKMGQKVGPLFDPFFIILSPDMVSGRQVPYNRFFDPFWPKWPKMAKNGSKTVFFDPKKVKKRPYAYSSSGKSGFQDPFLDPFLGHFWATFGPPFEPKSLHIAP